VELVLLLHRASQRRYEKTVQKREPSPLHTTKENRPHYTPTIAKKTNHSKEAVDRYIRDYDTVKLLTKVSTDPEVIGRMARLSKKVVQQYLDLIPEPEKPKKSEKEQKSLCL